MGSHTFRHKERSLGSQGCSRRGSRPCAFTGRVSDLSKRGSSLSISFAPLGARIAENIGHAEEMHMRTQVAIIGAGPAGVLLSPMLHHTGADHGLPQNP